MYIYTYTCMTGYKTSMLVKLVSANDFFRDHFLCYKHVSFIILCLTSNKSSITHPRDNVR